MRPTFRGALGAIERSSCGTLTRDTVATKGRRFRMLMQLAVSPSSWPEESSSPSEEQSLQDLLFGSLNDSDGDDDDDINFRSLPSELPLEVRRLAKFDPREVTDLATLQSAVFSPHLKSMGSSYMQQRMFEQGLKDADCTLVALLSPETAASLLRNELDGNDDDQGDGTKDNLSGAAAVAEDRAKARAAAAASETAVARANTPAVVGGAQAARITIGGLALGAEPTLDTWYVSGVVVDPRARGFGIGRALVNGLIAAARSADPKVGAICLHVAPTNAAALALYRGAGFMDYERDLFIEALPVDNAELESTLRKADGAHEGETLMALKIMPDE